MTKNIALLSGGPLDGTQLEFEKHPELIRAAMVGIDALPLPDVFDPTPFPKVVYKPSEPLFVNLQGSEVVVIYSYRGVEQDVASGS